MNRTTQKCVTLSNILDTIETNLYEYFLHQAQLSGCEHFDSAEVNWTFSRGVVLNRIFGASFKAVEANRRVGQIAERFKKTKTAVTWVVTATPEQEYLVKHLKKHGFAWQGNWVGMYLDLAELKQTFSPPGLVIRPVKDIQTLRLWQQTANKGFGFPASLDEAYLKMLPTLDLANNNRWRPYLAWLNGVPVATCALYMGSSSVGVYWTSTITEARNQGIATALTYHVLSEAYSEKQHCAVLHSTASGLATYKRLGFQKYCTINIYAWKPNWIAGRVLRKIATPLHPVWTRLRN